MADPSSDLHVVTPSSAHLDLAGVSAIESELAAAQGEAGRLLAIDLSKVVRQTPQGVAALLSVVSRLEGLHVALCGLPRPLLATAIDVGLAELVPIYASADAVQQARPGTAAGTGAASGGAPVSRALIHEIEHRVGAGWLDIAGRPLLVRQLQWLRDVGIEEVVVEVCVGADDIERGAWLLGDDPLLARVTVVPSPSPLGADELADRAGIARDERVLHVPANVLAGGTIGLDVTEPTYLMLPLPAALRAPSARLALRARTEQPIAEAAQASAWGLVVDDLPHALEVACAALEGRAPGIIVHAREQEPGVWLSRGAHLASRARVEPPIYLGIDVLVLDGAQVGPRAVILDRSVVERGASVIDGCVAAGTLVGEGTRVRRAFATPRALISFDDGVRTSVMDPLVLASRARATTLSSRLVALCLLLLLGTPWLVLAGLASLRRRPAQRTLRGRGGVCWRIGSLGIGVLDLLPPLVDVLLGARDLLGIARPDLLDIAARRAHPSFLPRAGALDLTARIAAEAPASIALRMWRWYACRKTNSLDRDLLRAREPRA